MPSICAHCTSVIMIESTHTRCTRVRTLSRPIHSQYPAFFQRCSFSSCARACFCAYLVHASFSDSKFCLQVSTSRLRRVSLAFRTLLPFQSHTSAGLKHVSWHGIKLARKHFIVSTFCAPLIHDAWLDLHAVLATSRVFFVRRLETRAQTRVWLWVSMGLFTRN